jgi:hypothetical protein
VRSPEEYAAGHLPGFLAGPGGQLVQETDHHAPVRGARIVLADDDDVRAPVSASWLAQMGWEVYVIDPLVAGSLLAERAIEPAETQDPAVLRANRCRRPYEGADAPQKAMQDYLEWEYGLVAQLARDGTHGFNVLGS